MNNLTLQQMESLDIGKWMSDIEKEKAIAKALELQALCLNLETNEVVKIKTLEETLRDGGLFTYTLGKKKYKLNVLTKADLAVLDNLENDIEAGIEYDIPKAYRYHIRNGHDNYVTVRAKSYEEAQQVVDSIYGIGLYSISASNL